MKKPVCVLCAIIFLIGYSAIKTSGNSERIASENTVRVFGIVTDMNGVPVPNATLTFTSSEDTAGTISDDAGMYSVYLQKDPTGVEESPKPGNFILYQNYPNPFNPSTVIQYSLDEYADVNLDIYSITGQHVRSLANSSESPGMHRVVWDGRNEEGSNVSAGIYLYQLRSGSSVQAKKMVLLDGAVSNSGFSGKISAPTMKKSADYDSEKRYNLLVEKSKMIQFGKEVYVSDDQSEFELNIELPIIYRPYGLFFDSNYFNNYYIFPGDTLGVTLVGIHEEGLPSECQLSLETVTGDNETITLSGSYNYIANFGLCERGYYGNSRKGSILSSIDPPIPGNGILEVNAHADSVFATYVFSSGDFLTTAIAVIDSLETIVTWGKTYVHWGNDWYLVTENIYWERILHNSFTIRFKESTTENEISEFIQSNNLKSHNILITGSYILKFNEPTNAIQFLQEQEGNTIIEYIEPNREICVN